MGYDQFISEWQGKQVTKYGSQCVALIAEFQAENNKPIIWADAALWANHPQLKAVYTWVANDPNNASQLPNRGDIIIWDGRLPYTNGSGHIAFYDHNLGNHQMMTFGQNSGGPTAHFQPHSWEYVAGWYVVTVPAVAHPAPAPAHPYQVVESFPEGRQFKVHPGRNKWGMNYDNLAAMEAHPVNTANDNTTFIAVEKVHHQTGGMYYRAANDPDGWNVVDCDAFTPPPPPPAPYVPPAAPIPVPTVEKYELLVPVSGYTNTDDARNRNNPVTIVDKGTYILLEANEKTRHVVQKNTDKTSYWINDFDNKPPTPQPDPIKVTVVPTPAPAPIVVEPPKPQVSPITTITVKPNEWKTTNVALRLDRQADIFYRRDASDITVYDLDGSRPPIQLHAYTLKDGMNEPTPIPIISTFWKDGVEYGRTPKAAKEGWWYGVPMSALDYGSATTIADRVANNTAKFGDRLAQIIGGVERLIQDVKARKAKK